jgi:RimJ/RimL family protein N-acetyltransferase
LIETERLLLRDCVPEDADVVLRLLNEPSFLENIGDRGVHTPKEAAAYLINGPIASYAEHGYGMYMVELRKTGKPVGMCGLLRRTQFEHPDVGYAFFPEFWGRGFASEAASGVIEHARRTLGIGRVLGIVSPHNSASIQVLEKIGFTFQEPAVFELDGSEVLVYVSNEELNQAET